MGKKSRNQQRKRRHRRVRAKIHGTAERPRLNIYRSNENIYAQVIDDDAGHTICAASTIDREIATNVSEKPPIDQAKLVGMTVAKRAQEAGISKVVFDRGGFRYHGRVKALADGAREGGLDF